MITAFTNHKPAQKLNINCSKLSKGHPQVASAAINQSRNPANHRLPESSAPDYSLSVTGLFTKTDFDITEPFNTFVYNTIMHCNMWYNSI